MAIDYQRAREVIERVRKTGALQPAVDELRMSRNTFLGWLEQDQDLADDYARAKRQGIDALVEDTLRIADEPPPLSQFGTVDSGAVADKKVRIETRRWFAERLEPRKYGVKSAVDLTNSDGKLGAVDDTARAARVAALLAVAQKRQAATDSTPGIDDIC